MQAPHGRRRPAWTVVLGGLVLAAVVSVSGMATPQNPPVKPAEAKDSDMTAVKRDQAYQKMLRTLEALEVVYRQQPSNRAALERYRQALCQDVASLRQTTQVAP